MCQYIIFSKPWKFDTADNKFFLQYLDIKTDMDSKTRKYDKVFARSKWEFLQKHLLL